MTPEEMQARVLYRDALMLVIDKPAGLAVHKGPKGGVSLEDFFDALRFGLPRRPSLAHRLDRDTSGCLVLGRHRKALAELGKLFKRGLVGKTYWAVVEGGPAEDEGRIELPLGRLDDARGWWMKPDAKGQPAVTAWKVLGRTAISPPPLAEELAERSEAGGGLRPQHLQRPLPIPPAQAGERAGRMRGAMITASDRLTWLALEPLTGRTHQLRVHCAAMGWPVVGDAIYGSAPRSGGPPLHLHAREVVVPFYKNRDPIRVIAPVPEHMRARLQDCGWREGPSAQNAASC